MKSIFILLIAFFICGFSVKSKVKMKNRVSNLEKCILMFENIETQIKYSSENIYKILKTTQKNIDLEFLDLFLSMDLNKDITERWSESIQKKSYNDCLKNEDVQVLCSFGKMLGTTDVDGQINNCKAHKVMLKNCLDNARENYNKKGNVVTTLGLLGAICFVVLVY